ncbi:MAG: CDP-alcohol phosphatidyltransferase family protein [Candidatus Anstonellaceae archaeon]
MLKKMPTLQKLQSKIGASFSVIPLSANQWTLLSLLPALLGFYAAYLQLPLHSLALFVLSGAIDALDGAVARAKKQVSAKGAYIDGITDRLVEFLFVLSFLFFPLPPFALSPTILLVIILFFGSTMTSFATAYAEHRGVAGSKKIAKQPGILPRTERLLLLFAALALVPFSPVAASFLLFATAALSFITFCQRAAYFAG